MEKALTFNNVQLVPVIRNNQPWIRSTELAHALGYKDEASVSRIYKRNADEFSNDMSVTVNLTVRDMPVETRIFSLRGCHLLAMFARTSVAKAFRKWVLDILDSLAQEQQPQAEPPQPDTSVTITQAQRCTLKTIVDTRLHDVPADLQGKARAEIWSRFNRHFKIAEYAALPIASFDTACDYLMEVKPKTLASLQQQALPAGNAPAAPPARVAKSSMAGWIDELIEMTQPIIDKFEKSNGSFHLQFGLDIHSHRAALSLNEEMLIQAVHDYTEMVFKGANIMLAGIRAVRKIRAVHTF